MRMVCRAAGSNRVTVCLLLLATIALAGCGAAGSPSANTVAATSAPTAVTSIQPNASSISGTSTTAGNIDGFVDQNDCTQISGWARDKRRPEAQVTVEVYDSDRPLGTLVASDSRPDLAQAGISDGRYGFRYPIPAQLRDGKAHTLRVRVAGTDTFVPPFRDTPTTITCAP